MTNIGDLASLSNVALGIVCVIYRLKIMRCRGRVDMLGLLILFTGVCTAAVYASVLIFRPPDMAAFGIVFVRPLVTLLATAVVAMSIALEKTL